MANLGTITSDVCLDCGATPPHHQDDCLRKKNWTESTTYDEIIEPVRGAILWAIGVDSGIITTDFDYDGYDTPATAHICLSPREALTIEHVEQSGQSALGVVLNVIFRLGYEQGWRRSEPDRKILNILSEHLNLDKLLEDK